MPSDTITPAATGPLTQIVTAARESTREQRGLAAAALVAFVGVAVVGPAFTRLMTPKSRAARLKDEAAFQAETMRRRAQKTGVKMRKKARRLGGGTIPS